MSKRKFDVGDYACVITPNIPKKDWAVIKICSSYYDEQKKRRIYEDHVKNDYESRHLEAVISCDTLLKERRIKTIKEIIFHGNGEESYKDCYILHMLLEEAFNCQCAMQQGSSDEEERIKDIAADIVRGLLGCEIEFLD